MSRLTQNAAGIAGLVLVLLVLLSFSGQVLAADPDSEELSREAREALNRSDYAEAAKLFAESRKLAQEKEEISLALYWEAFSRSRLRPTHELKRAAELLNLEEMQYADRETRAESEALAARIYGELARRGEADAVREVHERAKGQERRVQTRVAALQALLQMDPDRALPMLEKIMQDDSPENRELRNHAVMVACHQGGPKFQTMLLDMLETETDEEFLENVIFCVAMNPSDEGIDKLMGLFQRNKNPHLAEAILISMMNMDDHQQSAKVFSFLTTTVKDKSLEMDIRQHALLAMSEFDRDEELLEFLDQFSDKTESPEMQEAMLMALANMDNAKADKILMDMINQENLDEDLKTQALYSLGAHSKLSVQFLQDIYSKAGPESEDLKSQVWHLLSMHKDQDKALDVMLDFARNEKDLEVKQDMVFWLGQFDDPRAADFLVEILEDKH